jgi:hypothetical protein
VAVEAAPVHLVLPCQVRTVVTAPYMVAAVVVVLHRTVVLLLLIQQDLVVLAVKAQL